MSKTWISFHFHLKIDQFYYMKLQPETIDLMQYRVSAAYFSQPGAEVDCFKLKFNI